MDKISIVIPVFNVSQYIVECFESILEQGYPDFEVVCVDDGSTDDSGQICDEYAARDGRFRLIRTTHRGVGLARNLALANATGELCLFLDPDDLLAPGALIYMVDAMRRHDSDIVLGISHNFQGSPRDIEPIEDPTGEVVCTGQREIVSTIVFDKRDLRPMSQRSVPPRVNFEFFSCLYRTSILKGNEIEFLPISYGEDTFVLLSYLMDAHTAVVVDRVTYLHRRNPTSTTFRYHPDYLAETKVYYSHYVGLFRTKAPEHAERAIQGLDAQYFFRCVSAVEREIFIGSAERTSAQMLATISTIRRDVKFAELLTDQNINCISQAQMRIIMHAVRLGIHAPIVLLARSRRLMAAVGRSLTHAATTGGRFRRASLLSVPK